MNDIDFDELDKAVNSLVTKRGGASSSEPERLSKEPKPTADSSSNRPDEPSITVTQGAAPHRHRLGARPARGNFIDIMAPKKPTGKTPSRVAGTVQPAHTEVVPETHPPATEQVLTEESESSRPASIVEEKPSVPRARQTAVPEKSRQEETTWPDPLDFHTQPDASTVSKETFPTESPFIQGAKVDKRPLGAFAQTAPQPTNPQPSDSTPADDASDASQREQELSPEPKPETIKNEEPAATEESPELKVSIEPEPTADEQTKNPSAQQQLHDTAMMSIPKQYKSADKTVSQEERPVFDIKEYHPPLLEATAHAAHRGSIWGKLFMALLIVALLVVAGYFVFMYVVESL